VDLRGYWRLLVLNRYVITVSILCGLLGATLFNYKSEKIFAAESQLFVSTPATSLDISALATGSSFSQQRVKSYAQIINSPIVLRSVIEKLNLDTTPEVLSNSVSANAPIDTVLISVEVRNSDPKQAAAIANAISDRFGIVVSELELKNIQADNPIKVTTVRQAIPPQSPISPKKTVNILMGLILGIILGTGIASIRKILDITVKNSDDLFGIPLTATIGFDEEAADKPLITDLSRYAARTEAFRTLRTNLKYIAPSFPAKVIAVSSALPNEGKTTSAINLAISFSQGGHKTILIEGDLRRPKISSYLDFRDHDYGLSELLKEKEKRIEVMLERSVKHLDKSGLWILPSGRTPGTPAELLSQQSFESLLSICRKKYEYILIDCPPLLPVTDAAIISSRVDGVVLIVHAGKTRKQELMGARAAIEAVNAKILGVVLNKIPANAHRYKYGYVYGYSRNYGETYNPIGKSQYKPTEDDLYRIEREEFFDRMAGKKFKEELKKDSELYDSGNE
jgi:capsular exopolysaccharide synthesis family protein